MWCTRASVRTRVRSTARSYELTTGFFCAAASIISMRGSSTNRSVSRTQPCDGCALPKGTGAPGVGAGSGAFRAEMPHCRDGCNHKMCDTASDCMQATLSRHKPLRHGPSRRAGRFRRLRATCAAGKAPRYTRMVSYTTDTTNSVRKAVRCPLRDAVAYM